MHSLHFSGLDYGVFTAYVLLIIGLGLWVSRRRKGQEKTAQDYFLANKSLPWWAIGASLIAANISAEQMIGMSGSGFAIGLGIASYEWMAAITLIIVGKFFLPVFLEKKIYTMPQFLEKRFDNRVRTSLAVFWLLVYVFVNLASVLYLGALSMQTIMGVPLIYGIIGLALFAAIYSIYGGLKAVAWTDIVQVVFLIGGGLITSWLALDAVSDGHGPVAGFSKLLNMAPEKFDMILQKGSIMISDGKGGLKDAYLDLPGIGVLVGGMWIANISYWGFNQYIIQRGLAAKSVAEAQKGVIFAGYLKILIPLIVVIPGIVAFALNADLTDPQTGYIVNDNAYPWLLHNFVPAGIKGLAFAALVAAIVSSLGSMINSTSTIFTMDIYMQFINKNATNKQMVLTGRLVSFIALLIAIIVAPQLRVLDQAFQYIQEYTGFITPGIVVIFLAGLFWKKATANAALWVAVLTIPLSAAFKILMPELAFLDRMGIVFLALALLMVIVSMAKSDKSIEKAVSINPELFKTRAAFNAGAIGICAIVAALYLLFW